MNSGYSEAFPLKRDRSIKGKWQNSSFCLEMSCTVNDELEVSKTISFPSINWSVKPSTGGPNFVGVIVCLVVLGKSFLENYIFNFDFIKIVGDFVILKVYIFFVLLSIWKLTFGISKLWKSLLLEDVYLMDFGISSVLDFR